jgi:F-box protein 21
LKAFERKKGCPPVLCAIYQEVTRKMGIVCKAVYCGQNYIRASLYPSLAGSVDSVMTRLTHFVWSQYDEFGQDSMRDDLLFYMRLECSMSPQDPNIITRYAEDCIRLGIQLDDAIQLLQV